MATWAPLALSLNYRAVNNSCFSSLFCSLHCNLTLSILRCLVVGSLSVASPSGRNRIRPRHLSHFLSPNHNSKHHYGFCPQIDHLLEVPVALPPRVLPCHSPPFCPPTSGLPTSLLLPSPSASKGNICGGFYVLGCFLSLCVQTTGLQTSSVIESL